jgi:hypothetical protein
VQGLPQEIDLSMGFMDTETEMPDREDRPLSFALSQSEQIKMLRKLLLYWDGQWFLKAVEAMGLEEAIALNARVRASFGRIEMRTLLRALDRRQAEDLAEALQMLELYGATFMGGALRASFVAIDEHQAEIIVRRCAAYEGAKRARLPRQDQSCVACKGLWNAWLETLLPGSQADVRYSMVQGEGDAYCHFLVSVRQGPEP